MGTHLTEGKWSLVSNERPPYDKIIIGKVEDLMRRTKHWIVTDAEVSGDRYADAQLMSQAKTMLRALENVEKALSSLNMNDMNMEAYMKCAACCEEIMEAINGAKVL